MPDYQYGRIRLLHNALIKHNIPDELVEQVMQGGEAVCKTAKPAIKTAWFREAMERMDRLMPLPQRQAVRESCACCLSGERLKVSKKIAKQHATLDERITAANQTPFVFGNSVKRESDGTITVRFEPEGATNTRCVCLGAVTEPISDSYCFCCGGHIKHHLQIALGVKVTCKVVHTALTTAGKEGCTFNYQIISE